MKTKLLIAFAFILLISLASVQALTISSVAISPKEVEPGETATIDINLKNNLEEEITDITVLLDLSGVVLSEIPGVPSTVLDIPFAPYDSSNEITIDKIKEDKSKMVGFKIIALTNAESGIYKIPIRLTYYDGDENKHEKNSLISVTVNSEPEMGATIEDGLLLKGKENEVTVKVTNKGLSDARFVEIDLSGSTYYTTLSQKNVYIGDIDSDDFDTAKFRLYFKENVPSTVNMHVTVTYRDSVNNKYTEDFILPLKVYSEKQAIGLGLLQKSRITTYIVVVIIIIIIWFVYRKIKKRRKQKKAKEK